MDFNSYLQCLSVSELEVEYATRGLNSRLKESKQYLIERLKAESSEPQLMPAKSHVHGNPEIEIGHCLIKSQELLSQSTELGHSPSIEDLFPVYAKSLHWHNRAVRVENTFGNIQNINSIVSSLRRSTKHFRKLLAETETNPKDNTFSAASANNTSTPKTLPKTNGNTQDNLGTLTGNTSLRKSSSQDNLRKTPTGGSAITDPPLGTDLLTKISTLPSAELEFLAKAVDANLSLRAEHDKTKTRIHTLGQLGEGASAKIPTVQSIGNIKNSRANELQFQSCNPQSRNSNLQAQHFVSMNQARMGDPSNNFRNFDINPVSNIGSSSVFQSIPLSHRSGPQPQVNFADVQANNPYRDFVPFQNNQYPLNNYGRMDRDFNRKRWNIMFDGTSSMNVIDFLYRLQTMAIDDQYPVENLTRVLHLFVSGKASDWFWIFKQNNPLATWVEMRTAMVSYFNSYESEDETKEQIVRRFQGSKESFADFALDIQKLNSRLNHRMTELEIIRRLCQNMHPALRNATLAHQANFNTIDELRILCERFEKLWNRTRFDPRDSYNSQFRRNQHINELETDFEFYLPSPEVVTSRVNESPVVDALQNSSKYLNDDYLICWNCKDIGHRYQDCSQSPLHEFCYGCGLPNVRKYNCMRCQKRISGNVRPSVSQSRESRSEPKTLNASTQVLLKPPTEPSKLPH